MKTEYFECVCFSDEHMLKFILDDGKIDNKKDYEPELYCGIFLEETSFFSRLYKAIKYVFGYKCKYGHFGNWVLNKNDADKLKELLLDYKKLLQEYNS